MSQSILIIGHGAIGSCVANQIQSDEDIRIKWVLCRPGREADAEKAIPGATAVTCVSELTEDVDYALECAGHASLKQHGQAVLSRGIDLGVVSIGALSDQDVLEALETSATAGNATINLLSGAIGGLDALAAARQGGLHNVNYIGRKPPAGWKGSAAEEVVDLDQMTEPCVHFTGSAREAAKRYPKNANVAAAVAFAGLGLDETMVTLIADPAIEGNRHEIQARGAFGEFTFAIDGRALPNNPKSSYLTAMSAVRALRNLASITKI